MPGSERRRVIRQPSLPGMEDWIGRFIGCGCWPELLAHARQVAATAETFTVDDLTYQGPQDQRIKGAVLQYLKAIGEIEAVEVTRTLRPTSHGRPVLRWRRVALAPRPAKAAEASEPTYALTLSSCQARLVARALDFWCRVRMGQLEALEAAVRPHPGPMREGRALRARSPKPPDRDEGDRPVWRIDWDALREALAVVRGEMFPWLPPDASDLDFPGGREAFNLRKVIDHAVSWHESPLQPGELPTVNYDGPIADWWPTPFHARMVPVKDEGKRDA